MTFKIRLLGPDDQDTLHLIAKDDADFDIDGRGKALEPLELPEAKRFLTDPTVSHWIALEGPELVGHLYGHRLLTPRGEEFLMYEIGVRSAHRRQGVGTALVEAMFQWMDVNQVKVAWVIADNPGAIEFYKKCGLKKVEGSLTQMDIRRD